MKRGPQEDDRKESGNGGVEDAPRRADVEDVEDRGRLGSLPDAQGEERKEEVAPAWVRRRWGGGAGARGAAIRLDERARDHRRGPGSVALGSLRVRRSGGRAR